MDGASNESKKAMGSYLLQDGWPQAQAISASPDPASSQSWLQYFSPGGGTHTQGRCEHFFEFSAILSLRRFGHRLDAPLAQ